MANGYRTADDVADMEQELHELRTQLDSAMRSLDLVTQERNRLQVENALLDGKARETLIRATRIETIMQQTAAQLVAGLKELHQERETARAVRRHAQEEAMDEENRSDPPPQFLRRDPAPLPQTGSGVNPPQPKQVTMHVREPARGLTPEEGQRWRAEALVGAAEKIAPRSGRVNTSIASRDPRLPQAEFRTAQQEDEDNLRDIADSMDRRG